MLKVSRMLVCCVLWLSLVHLCTSVAAAAQDSSVDDAMQQLLRLSSPVAITFILSVLVLKVTAFVLGFLIVKLGHDTMIKGVKGDIDFGFSGSGVRAKLKSGSPGAFFVLAGAAIIIWGLLVEKPMSIKYTPVADQQKIETKTDSTPPGKLIQVPK
jgi:hypothetical protein